MIGFAVASFKENGFGGLLAQGLGTSMLQVPNIVRRPLIWLPAIISSAILGPVGTMVFKMTNTATGSGMGTAGLVGQITTFQGYEQLYGFQRWCWFLCGYAFLFCLEFWPMASILVMRKNALDQDGDMKLEM